MASLPLLTVFGATGATGKHVVSQALESDALRVRVFVRSPDKLPAEVSGHARLEVVKGDFSDLEAVDAALEGSTYVICTAWNPAGSKAGPVMAPFAKRLIEAAVRHGVTRLIYQAGAFTVKPGEKQPVKVKVMRTLFGVTSGSSAGLKENDAIMEQFAAAGDKVKWAVTRPGVLKEIPSQGTAKALEAVPSKAVAFADLAAFSLSAVQSGAEDGKAPFVGY